MKTKTDTISTAALAQLCNLTERRITQFVSEGKLSRPIRHGVFAMPTAIQQLFAVYQGSSGEIAVERLKLLTAKRRLAEGKVEETVVDAVPLSVVEKAAQEFGYFLDRLPNELYIHGIPLTPEGRETVEKLAKRTKNDFLAAVRQWLARQQEIAVEEGAKTPAPESEQVCPPHLMPMTTFVSIAKFIVGRLESLPDKAVAAVGLSGDQAVKFRAVIDGTRHEIAADISELTPKEKA
jgi:hypothetical protein